MTDMGTTFQWILWHSDGNLSAMSDEFLVEGFRVRLMGNRLEVSFEPSGSSSLDSARKMAGMYVEALGKHGSATLTLLTEAEWLKRTTPPFGNNMAMFSANREHQRPVENAVREARNELLALEDESLRRCYDYLQDARECMRLHDDKGAHFAVYEAMEVLEAPFKSKKERVAALGEFHEKAKTAANTKRHILEKVMRHPNSSEHPVALATMVIRNYERHLLVEEQKKREDRP